jgi:hypothetical protein
MSDRKEAARSGAGRDFQPDNFDDYVVIERQPRTTVYINPNGQAVIRQDAADYGEDDPFVVISPEHIEAVIAALRQTAKVIAEALKDDPHAFKLEDEPEAPSPATPPSPPRSPPPLTLAEVEKERRCSIREGLRVGRSKRSIAAELGCSEATVRRIAATLGATQCDSDAPMTHLNGANGALAPTLFVPNEETEATPAQAR